MMVNLVFLKFNRSTVSFRKMRIHLHANKMVLTSCIGGKVHFRKVEITSVKVIFPLILFCFLCCFDMSVDENKVQAETFCGTTTAWHCNMTSFKIA